jgi:hypothetical protein
MVRTSGDADSGQAEPVKKAVASPGVLRYKKTKPVPKK